MSLQEDLASAGHQFIRVQMRVADVGCSWDKVKAADDV